MLLALIYARMLTQANEANGSRRDHVTVAKLMSFSCRPKRGIFYCIANKKA